MQVEINRVSASEIYDVRHRNLRHNQPRGSEQMPGIDDAPTTIHLKLCVNDVGVGCATFMVEQNQDCRWRLRGMAIDAEYRRQGLGQKLIQFFLDMQPEAGGIWCNARVSAMDFYSSCGFIAEGDEFDIPPIGPHYVMRLITDPR